MTVTAPEKHTCALCGKKSPQEVIYSTNTFGRPDLDLRPSEMMRSTMSTWVLRCPHCGYCAPSIEEAVEGAAQLVKGDRYRKLRNKRSYPILARDFLCWSLLAENAGKDLDAAWAALYAAWVLDDHENARGAAECRGRAADLFLQARKKRRNPCRRTGESELLITDVLRRCGRFDEARELCEKALLRVPAGMMEKVLLFEWKLIRNRDTERHTVDEALSCWRKPPSPAREGTPGDDGGVS
ncbi:MAG: hypothetical protein H5T73_11115 [Actinobacteria bacterium]|nr:hypothetical protein [Actinomycetota bacterium]